MDKKQRINQCFLALTLCCVSGSMFGQNVGTVGQTADNKATKKKESQKVSKGYTKFSDEAINLDNVVVTALGIKREEKSLGYSTQTVSGDNITSTMPTNWSQALQGQVAGLNVISAGGPLSSTQINLRGNVSMNMDGNGALIVGSANLF